MHILRITQDDHILEPIDQAHQPFFLSVGTNSQHKNLKILVHAIEGLSISNETPQLVVVGEDFSKTILGCEKLCGKIVKSLGFITDEQLRALYEHAIGLIFPSLY